MKKRKSSTAEIETAIAIVRNQFGNNISDKELYETIKRDFKIVCDLRNVEYLNGPTLLELETEMELNYKY